MQTTLSRDVYHQVVYNFRVKRDLPKYDLERPPGPFNPLPYDVRQGDSILPRTEGEACVVFPLFQAYEGIIPWYIINSAFWAAHAWRVNTTAIEAEWDIWFFVEESLYAIPEVQALFVGANLSDFVVTFPAPRQGAAVRHKLGNKLYAMTDPAFRWYKRAYLWDTDNFVSTRDGVVLDVSRLLDIGEDESLVIPLFWNAPDPTDLKGRGVWREKYELEISDDEAKEFWDGVVNDYLGYVPENYHGVSGQLMAWNPRLLRQDFKDMVLELTPDLSDDEDQYSLYLRKTEVEPWPLNDIWHIPMYYVFEDLLRDDPVYFDHVWLPRNEVDGEVWHQQAGVGEVAPVTAYDDPAISEVWRENIGLRRRL